MSLQHGEWWIDESGDATFADGDTGDVNHEMVAFAAFIGLDEEQLERIDTSANGINYYAAAEAFLEDNDISENLEELQQLFKNGSLAEKREFADKYGLYVDLEADQELKYGTLEDVPLLPWQEKNPAPQTLLEQAFREHFNVGHPNDSLEVALGTAWLEANGADMEFIKWWDEQTNPDAREYAVEHHGWVRIHDDNFEVWEFTDDTLSNIQAADLDWSEEDDKGIPLDESQEEVWIEERSTNKTYSVPVSILLNAKNVAELRAQLEGPRSLHRKVVTEEEGFSAYNNPVTIRGEEVYDPDELAMGIEIEKEHTDDDAEASVIARQHLEEIPDYYSRLVRMERDAKKEAAAAQLIIVKEANQHEIVKAKDVDWDVLRLNMKIKDWVVITSSQDVLVWRWHEDTQYMLTASDLWLDVEPSDTNEPWQSADTVLIKELATERSFTVELRVLLDPNLDADEIRDEATQHERPRETPGQEQDWMEHLSALEQFKLTGEPLPGTIEYGKAMQKKARGRRKTLVESEA